MNDVIALLREADPAGDTGGYPDDRIAANVSSIVHAESAPRLETVPRSAPAKRRILVGAVAVAAVAAAIVAADVVSWPWSHGAAESAAYAITENADGSVDVMISWDQVKDPQALQDGLRAAGIPAVVIVESPAGACDEPLRDGTEAGYAAINTFASTTADQHKQGVVIRPSLLPSGSTIVVDLPFPGEYTDGSGGVGMTVTDQAPPTCIPQSFISDAATAPAPAPSNG